MFRKREYHKRSFLPFVILRLCLSLVMLLILTLGVYQAFKYFSQTDPLKLDPRQFITALTSSKEIGKVMSGFWGLNIVNKDSSEAKVENTPNTGKIILKFALVADSHSDYQNLEKALNQAKDKGAKFVIGLGDFSQVGTMQQLQKSKEIFNKSNLPYYITAGDHDLWDCRNRGLTPLCNFSDVFGPSYQTFIDSNIRFIIIYNSDNYGGVDLLQQAWLNETLNNTDSKSDLIFVFLHEPLYHPSSDHMMGKEEKGLVKQAQEISEMLKTGGVTEVFAGDTHAYLRYEDIKTGLKMTTVGALTKDQNVEKSSFVIVDAFDNGGYNIESVEIQ